MANWTIEFSFEQKGIDIIYKQVQVEIFSGKDGVDGSVRIDGYFVDPVGKTDLENWEVNDKFYGWVDNTRYVTGIVVALPFDVDDDTKVKLVIDNLI